MPGPFSIGLATKLLAWALTGVLLLMLVTWWFGRRIRNYGIVDVVWSFAFVPVTWLFAALGSGYWSRRFLVASLVTLWSLRLGIHLWDRVAAMHPLEDHRYAELRQRWGKGSGTWMLGFYLLQGVLIVILSLPFLLASLDSRVGITVVEWLAVGIFAVALYGERKADRQLVDFKAENNDPTGVCQTGLWRHSRHPNYFFEWLIWIAFSLLAATGPWGFLGFLSPLLMLHFLLNVSGIPLTEELAVVRKGANYLTYQKTTNRFVPWFRKDT